MWVVSIFVLIGFFVLAACLRPVIGQGFEWTCWWPCQKRKDLFGRFIVKADDEDEDYDLEDGDGVDR